MTSPTEKTRTDTRGTDSTRGRTDEDKTAKVEEEPETSGMVVTAPFITARVVQPAGTKVLLGFYQGARLPKETDEDDLERLERKGMIADEDSDEAAEAAPGTKTVEFGEDGMVTNEATRKRLEREERQSRKRREAAEEEAEDDEDEPKRTRPPHGNANQAAWVNFAVSQRDPGTSEADARTEAQKLSKEQLVAKYGKR